MFFTEVNFNMFVYFRNVLNKFRPFSFPYLYPMKKIFLILFLLLSIVSFAFPQKKKSKKVKPKQEMVTQIEYESFSRRLRTHIIITKDSAVSTTRNDKKFILVSKAEWNALTASLQQVKLEAIPALVSPTHQRETDGAMHCRMIIITKSNRYESQYFDCGKPMKQLAAVYEKTEAIKNTIEEEGKQYPE